MRSCWTFCRHLQQPVIDRQIVLPGHWRDHAGVAHLTQPAAHGLHIVVEHLARDTVPSRSSLFCGREKAVILLNNGVSIFNVRPVSNYQFRQQAEEDGGGSVAGEGDFQGRGGGELRHGMGRNEYSERGKMRQYR